MMTLLAVLGGLTGLLVTVSAMLMAWSVYSRVRFRQTEISGDGAVVPAEQSTGGDGEQSSAMFLLQWTFFDYALFVLFIIGSLFLFTDLLAVLRDAASFPPYHYGYLLCGFIFTFAAMLMMVIRLSMTVSFIRNAWPALAPKNDHNHPGETKQAE